LPCNLNDVHSNDIFLYFGDTFITNVAPNQTVTGPTAMTTFDYSSEAELFPTSRRASRPRPMGYRRFATAADAIRFAMEDLPPELLVGAFLEVEQGRYDDGGIRRLYESPDYPLVRRAAPAARGAARSSTDAR
jgi:hypothetical protein